MNRKIFFDDIRASLFDRFDQPQVDGLEAILDEWDKRALPDIRWLAYMLATTFHETNHTMQPVREAYWVSETWRKTHLRYYPYYGRGFVQLTWDYNYAKAGKATGVDLLKEPDRAMELPIATTVLFDGMIEGWFTGKKLADYPHNYTASRRIINGTDQALKIAGFAEKFEAALRKAA